VDNAVAMLRQLAGRAAGRSDSGILEEEPSRSFSPKASRAIWEEEVVLPYREGRLSLSEAARRLGLDPWAWLDLLRRRHETLNVELEDWIDTRSAL
jgi:hypothetical protein